MSAQASAPLGYVIYEYADRDKIGVRKDGTKHYFCTEDLVTSLDCKPEDLGKLISKSPSHPVTARWNEKSNDVKAELQVKSTGYFCVGVVNPTETLIKIQVDFANPFGDLPSEYRPLMLMSIWLAIVYLVCLAGWSYLLVRHRSVIVSFQKYVAGMLALSALEMLTYYIFYAFYNRTGEPSYVLLGLAAIVGSTRMTASLFIVLIVSMGYGTVLPSLEDRASPIYTLSLVYLGASVVNILASLTTRGISSLIWLLSTLAITVGGAAFMTWTFDSLKTTAAILLQRKQFTKLEMYNKLTALLKALYTLTILCMLLAVLFIGTSTANQAWYAGHWDALWLATDGWQSFLNLAGCLGVAYIFRPRSNNRTHAMNELSSEPLDDDEAAKGPVDMKTYRSFESKQHEQESQKQDYARIEDPDWATPEDPFESHDARR